MKYNIKYFVMDLILLILIVLSLVYQIEDKIIFIPLLIFIGIIYLFFGLKKLDSNLWSDISIVSFILAILVGIFARGDWVLGIFSPVFFLIWLICIIVGIIKGRK